MPEISGKTSEGKIITISVDDDGHLQIDNLELRIFGQTEEDVILPILVDDDGKIITSTNGDGEVTASSCFIETIQYQGDGTTSQVIELVDTELIVKHIQIQERFTDVATMKNVYVTNDLIVDDHVDGMSWTVHASPTALHSTILNAIIALGTGEFTVDDAGLNYPVNASGVTYIATVWGVHAVE